MTARDYTAAQIAAMLRVPEWLIDLETWEAGWILDLRNDDGAA